MKPWRLIFDLGGVLVRWDPAALLDRFYDDPALRDAVLAAVHRHPDWLELDRGTLLEPEAVERFAARTGRPQDEMARLMQATRESLTPLEDSWALARRLHAAGVPLLVLSNMADPTYRYLRARIAGWELFSGIVISAHERLVKPQPEIFHTIIRRYGLEPARSLFIDDMPVNVQAAHEAGLAAIVFRDARDCAERISKTIGLPLDPFDDPG